MTVVSETVTLPGGAPSVNTEVELFLAGTNGVPIHEAYVGGKTIVDHHFLVTDATGVWSANLQPNADIVPTGTAWARRVKGKFGLSLVFMNVPAGGPVRVGDILTEAPASINTSTYNQVLLELAGKVDKSTLTTDGDILTRAGGVPARMTRAQLAADAAFTGAFEAVFDNTPVRLGTETYVYKIVDMGGGVVLAATAPNGSVYRSTNYGITWALLQANAGGAATLHDLIHLGNGVLLGATDNASRIARSTDYGATWAAAGSSPQLAAGGYKVNCLCQLDNGVVLAGHYDTPAGSGKVHRSTDGGATWSAGVALGNSTGVDVLIDLGGGVVVAGGQANTTTTTSQWWRSTDYGVSFTQIAPGAGVDVSAGEYGHAGVVQSDGSLVVGTYGGGSASHIYRSTDDGVTFTKVADSGDGTLLTGFQGLFWIEDLGGGTLLAGTGINAGSTCKLLLGQDWGRRWTELQTSWTGAIPPSHVLTVLHVGGGVVLLGMGTSGEVRRGVLSPRAEGWVTA